MIALSLEAKEEVQKLAMLPACGELGVHAKLLPVTVDTRYLEIVARCRFALPIKPLLKVALKPMLHRRPSHELVVQLDLRGPLGVPAKPLHVTLILL
jgi:hypothetical protein